MRINRGLAAVTGLLLLGLAALTGCGKDAAAEDAPAEKATITVTDPWAKAAERGMSAIFGTLVNHSTADLTVVSATAEISPLELHEVVTENGEALMRPKEGGFAVAAGAEHPLAPGGDHIMLMDLARTLAPGDDVTVTLALSDGSAVVFTAIVKDFAGADESYDPGMGH
ncbi:copper chaperone PCu(A)C [Phytomonospora sp. NPDC050363]|uniref:copper chaperone PCu(A)C n=1 Tax=Phytomonospora sp. NPDC050363 TaxID=3155642 RepID=UPI0033C7D364